MSRRVVGITSDTLADLPSSCRACAFWELSAVHGQRARDSGTQAAGKQAWIAETSLEWGPCGQLIYVDDTPAGYLLYAPPAYVPRADGFATSPPASDSLLLITGRIVPEFGGQGLGRVLVQAAAREAVQRGVRALEAFGRVTASRDVPAANVSGGCLLPVEYLSAVGFRTVRAHPSTPRLRLDVRTAITWREDVESAIERLFRTLPATVLSR